MSNGFEQEEYEVMTEIKIALVTILAVVFWIWSVYLTKFDITAFPTIGFTGVLLVFGGIWIGFVLKRRKRRTGSIRKDK